MDGINWDILNGTELRGIAFDLVQEKFRQTGFSLTTFYEQGVNFSVSRGNLNYDIVLKPSRNFQYTYLQKHKYPLNEKLYISLIIFLKNYAPKIYLLPSTAWLKPNEIFVSRDYVGKQSKPEWGFNLSFKNLPLLEKYAIDEVLENMIGRIPQLIEENGKKVNERVIDYDVTVEKFEKVLLGKKFERRGFNDRLSISDSKDNDLDNVEVKARHLIDHICSLSNFKIESEIDGNYDHIGATITDAVLQAGLKYETVVKPKVMRLKNEFPEATTTSGFLSLIDRMPVDKLLQKQNGEGFKGDKPSRIFEVAQLFHKEGVETESDLKQWLESENSWNKLIQIKGIGNKTIDYFKICRY
jgi:hypothetical protein